MLLLFWPHLSHLKSNSDDVKCKACILNYINLTSYLANHQVIFQSWIIIKVYFILFYFKSDLEAVKSRKQESEVARFEWLINQATWHFW